MIRLEQTLQAWENEDFTAIFKQELARLTVDQLPLQQGLTKGSHVTADPITVLVNHVAELHHVIRIRVGIFYQSVIAGCSCADDPTPVDVLNEYCEMQLEIDKTNANTVVTLVSESV